jgi:hypothetical protein
MSVLGDLTDGPGYCLDHRLTPSELADVRGMVTRHYLGRLRALAPGLAAQAAAAGIEDYHTLPVPFDHARAWPKEARLLPQRHLADFRRLGFFRRIEEELGPVMISHGELNWRLVRPGRPEDVGPAHLDRWFWEGGYGRMPAGHDRFKVWVPVCCEPGANGLAVRPFSQNESGWKYHFEVRDGVCKPVLDEDEGGLGLLLLPLGPGEMVMFHDGLLHAGVANRGRRCRVSVELTILYREEGARRPRRPAPLARLG